MRCSRCGSEVLTPTSSCPSCGETLQAQSPNAAIFNPSLLNASDIVLLFGDRFAKLSDEGYRVPCSQVEVSVSSLVVATVTAALASLAGEGLISVAKGLKKGFLFKSEAAMIRKEKNPESPRAGLEGRILANISGDEQKDSLKDIIKRLLGQSTMDPYTVVLSQAMEHAHQAGFFVEDDKAPPIMKFMAGKTVATPLSPLCDRIKGVAGEAPKVQALLEAFKGQSPDLYALIGKDVKKTIDSVYIQS